MSSSCRNNDNGSIINHNRVKNAKPSDPGLSICIPNETNARKTPRAINRELKALNSHPKEQK